MRSDVIYRQDTIDRQQAIDAVHKAGITEYDETLAIEEIERVPAAQPDIIRCGECRHLHDNDCPVVGWGRDDDDYCAWAERDNDE